MDPSLSAHIRIVQSPANRWVKALRAARSRPAPFRAAGAPDEQPLIALEGFHLIAEALSAAMPIQALILREGEEHRALEGIAAALNIPGAPQPNPLQSLLLETQILSLPEALFREVAGTESPQAAVALATAPVTQASALFTATGPALVLVAAALQDPGNLGTILRSALAFGATGAILLSGTVSPWNTKCLRASAGAALRLPLYSCASPDDAATLLHSKDVRSFAAVVSNGTACTSELAKPAALWIGNEGSGLSADEIALCDEKISIPMHGSSESLNAAVAASVLLYEAACQRRTSNTP